MERGIKGWGRKRAFLKSDSLKFLDTGRQF